ncbi:MAG: arylsulfatase A-like enzyme [Planctomycetota bacterium]|jgi:arylsulfatase A-like enzyme
MKIRLITLAAVLTVLAGCQTAPAPTRAPNIVMIIADDQAWGDFGFMGHPDINTPHLDQLAADSAVFERGYVPSSLCRPSLATMITGLYPHQHLITGNDPPRGVQRDRMLKHIAAVPTLPRVLALQGYRSLQTGKWWEGNCQCGGFTEGMTHGEPERGGRHGDVGLEIGRETMQPIFDFVADCGDDPFLLWYAPLLPHTPHNPPERLLARYRTPGRSLHVARYFAMCEWFDETCGQLLDDLEERGLRENTIVLFASDNGWIQRTDSRGYAPRSKRSPNEGGVRTPIMISWPGHVTPGTREQLASTIDFAPTVLRACGVDSALALPGLDLVELAESKATERKTVFRQAVFGEIFAHDVADIDDPSRSLLFRWMVSGQWKLIVPATGEAPMELYDVLRDPAEEYNLAAEQPDRVLALRDALDRWWSPN